jgi:serine/threonine protein kinase
MTDWSAGSRVCPHEILGPIGEGGMGKMWKARDARLDRIVAIKRLKGEHRIIPFACCMMSGRTA